MLHDLPLGRHPSTDSFPVGLEENAPADTLFAQGDSRTDRSSADYVDLLEDVFGSAPSSPALPSRQPHTVPSGAADPSDIPRLRSIHVTNGYREGIAASRETHIQTGFDEGYGLGAELGLQVGWCLGSLQALCHATPQSVMALQEEGPASTRATSNVDGPYAFDARASLQRAQHELAPQALLSSEYFGPDGIWIYSIPENDDSVNGSPIMFSDVAAAHPVVRKWRDTIVIASSHLGLKLVQSS